MTYTRREAIALGAGIGAALLTGRHAVAQSPLVEKAIPGTSERLPVIGLGGRNFRSGPDVAPTRYRDTITTFANLGGKVIDTAPSYGDSESIIGGIVRDANIRNQLFLASKVDVAGRAEGAAKIEATFRAMGVPVIDLMQVHNLRDTATQLATLRELKAAERIRYVGITSSSDQQYAEMARIMETERLDFIQIDYAIHNRGAGDRILPLAADKGLGVLVNLPFGRGAAFRTVGTRPLEPWAAQIDCTSWAQVFLKYVVSHPAVTCAIPGTTQAVHAEDNNRAARGRMPDAAMRRTIEQYFDGISDG